MEIVFENSYCIFVLACSDANCVQCFTDRDVCNQCSYGYGVDASDNTCKGNSSYFHLVITTVIIIVIIIIK